MNARVVMLTSSHKAIDTRIFFKEAKGLVRNGYDVWIVAPGSWLPEVDRVRIVSVRRRSGFLGRIVNVISVIRAALKLTTDVYHIHDPEMLVAGPILRLLKRRSCRVYDLHEDFPAALSGRKWVPARLRRVVRRFATWYELLLIRHMDLLVHTTPLIANRFRQFSVQQAVVPNYLPLEEFRPEFRRQDNTALRLIFTGLMTPSRGLSQVLQACGSAVATGVRVELTLMGEFRPKGFADEIQKLLSEWGLGTAVKLIGPVPYDKMASILAQHDVGIIPYQPIDNHLVTVANKLFEFMGSGLAVLVPDYPLYEGILGDTGCGLSVDVSSPDRIAEAISYLSTHREETRLMGELGRQAILDRYNWSVAEAQLIKAYAAMLSRYSANRGDRGR